MSGGFVVWESGYSIGHKLIDRQHQQIIEMFNDLYEARHHGVEALVVGEVITAMSRYVREHFSAEEALMAAIHYPELAAHRLEHEFFIAEAGRLGFERDKADADQLMVFLKDWLLGHIAGTDHKFKPYLKI